MKKMVASFESCVDLYSQAAGGDAMVSYCAGMSSLSFQARPGSGWFWFCVLMVFILCGNSVRTRSNSYLFSPCPRQTEIFARY